MTRPKLIRWLLGLILVQAAKSEDCPDLCVCFPSVVNCMYLNYTFIPRKNISLDTEIL